MNGATAPKIAPFLANGDTVTYDRNDIVRLANSSDVLFTELRHGNLAGFAPCEKDECNGADEKCHNERGTEKSYILVSNSQNADTKQQQDATQYRKPLKIRR
jgi:hypothetical protein